MTLSFLCWFELELLWQESEVVAVWPCVCCRFCECISLFSSLSSSPHEYHEHCYVDFSPICIAIEMWSCCKTISVVLNVLMGRVPWILNSTDDLGTGVAPLSSLIGSGGNKREDVCNQCRYTIIGNSNLLLRAMAEPWIHQYSFEWHDVRELPFEMLYCRFIV